jgi:apolipoprotein N-acyltransferase
MNHLIKNYFWPTLSAVLLFLSFPANNLFPLAWIALIPIIIQSIRVTPLQSGWYFFVCGWIFHSLLLQWLLSNIMWGGGWAVLGYQLLCIYLASYWGLLGIAWNWIYTRNPVIGSALGLSVMWAAMEFLQGILFTGFGWSSLGYSQSLNLPIIQWASVGGHTLISSILIFTNTVAALMLAQTKDRFKRIAVLIVIPGALFGTGYLFIQEADYDSNPYTAIVVQPNFPLEMKWDREYTIEMVRNTAEKTKTVNDGQTTDLVVWPEASVMGPIENPKTRGLLNDVVDSTGAHLLTGAARSFGDSHYNSAYFFEKDVRVPAYYDKQKLAPFGEYVPLSDYLPFVQQVVPSIGDIKPGTEYKTFTANSKTLGPLICFEVLFSGMSQHLRESGVDVLVVMTNLAWFGSSNAIPQELAIAQMRAVETRLPLIHSSNTGISGVFDPYGRFEMVKKYINEDGIMYQLRDDAKPIDTRMTRLADRFKIANPGIPLLKQGPRIYPLVACGIAIVFFILSIIMPDVSKKKDKKNKDG